MTVKIYGSGYFYCIQSVTFWHGSARSTIASPSLCARAYSAHLKPEMFLCSKHAGSFTCLAILPSTYFLPHSSSLPPPSFPLPVLPPYSPQLLSKQSLKKARRCHLRQFVAGGAKNGNYLVCWGINPANAVKTRGLDFLS